MGRLWMGFPTGFYHTQIYLSTFSSPHCLDFLVGAERMTISSRGLQARICFQSAFHPTSQNIWHCPIKSRSLVPGQHLHNILAYPTLPTIRDKLLSLPSAPT